MSRGLKGFLRKVKCSFTHCQCQILAIKRTLEGFNYFSNPIAQGNGILSIFPPLEMSRRLKGFLRKVKCSFTHCQCQILAIKRTLEGFNYFSNPIAQGNGILSIFPPLEMSRRLKGFLRKVKCSFTHCQCQILAIKRTLEGFNYFSNPIAQGNGILSIFPPLEMSRRLKGLLRKVNVC